VPGYGNFFTEYFQYLRNIRGRPGGVLRGTERIRKGEQSSAVTAFPGGVKIFPAVKNGTGILMIMCSALLPQTLV
jgi:hypothetical protein